MRVLTIHNHYQQLGGEDTIFATESDLLESYGHDVYRHTIHNDDLEDMSAIDLAAATLWNRKSFQKLKSVIEEFRPDVAHFHNTFPLISPAAYYAAQESGVPVIQTLHNYRLLCPNGLFFRDGRVCEDCLGKPMPWPGIVHGCYRGSRVASGAVATMVNLHSLMGTWAKAVDIFIAYSQFALDKFIEGGIPKDKFEFKTNFLHPAPEVGKGKGGFGLFVGRLSTEKGLDTLLAAWEKLHTKVPLKIVGAGPLASEVEAAAKRFDSVEYLGRRPLSEVYDLMGEAKFFVFPSKWYETFGRVAIEAYAKGTPILASRIGAITELVKPYETGLLFEPGDANDLVTQVEWVLNHPDDWQKIRKQARQEFEACYTASLNYKRLMEIYQKAIALKSPTKSPAAA
ncbi:MAG: glycosyltransferase [Cyanobacteria bacterium P01_D01_bin.156]